MPTPISDETVLLREAIQEVLATATQPLTSTEIVSSVPVSSLGLTADRVSQELFTVFRRTKDKYPIERIHMPGRGRGTKYGYYNPHVYTPLEKRKREPVNGVNSADFQFNPVEFTGDAPSVVQDPTPNIVVPAGVRAIRLTVGGVSIAIEFA